MADYPLTDDQIDFYRANGFVALPDVLTTEELTGLRAAADEVLATRYEAKLDRSDRESDYVKIFVQKVNMWQFNEGIRRHTLSRRLAEIARRLEGVGAMRLWHDHLLTKMPGGESRPTPWHQDRPYWPMNELGQTSCWMALDDVNGENGCMSFLAGSHRWGLLEPVSLTSPKEVREVAPNADLSNVKSVQVPLAAGSCTFHSGLTFHSAGPNRTGRPRRAMVTIYNPADTTFSGKSHVVTNGIGLEPGEPFDHYLFPVLAGAA